MEKNKYLLLFAFFIAFSFIFLNAAYPLGFIANIKAQGVGAEATINGGGASADADATTQMQNKTSSGLEVKYPNIPGLIAPSPGCKGSDCLAIYIAYWFGLLVYIAGALALISFAVGAVTLIISVDNTERQSNAKDRMKGAVLGLVLVSASFIILRTINPTFITPSLTPLPGVQGIFYTNGKERKPVGISEADVANRGEELKSGGFNSIIYDCTGEGGGGTGPALLIWEFSKPGFDISGVTHVARKTCGQTEPIGGLGSFSMAFETPGIYYCLGGCSGKMCAGYMSGANTASQDIISDPFARNIGGVRIVNNAASNVYYGVIFHKNTGLANGGSCNVPIVYVEDGFDCFPTGNADFTSAADIFTLNPETGASGDGVEFYSEPHGWDTGQQAGIYKKKDTQIPFPPYSDPSSNVWSPNEFGFVYTKVDRKKDYTDKYKTFKDKPGSIRIIGNYLVGLYSGSGKTTYCQTFTKNVENLNAQPFIASGTDLTDFNSIYIFPTK